MDNDYELLYLAKEHNEEAVNLLYKKYYNLIYSKVKQYNFKSNILLDDYLNEAFLSFYNCIDNYQDQNTFKTYLVNCLDNALKNYRKKCYSQKNKLLNEYLPIENYDVPITISDRNNQYNPENIVCEEEAYNTLKEKIVNALTWKEELVFNLRLENYSPKEISQITDNNLKNVYNIIKRIEAKIVKLVSY